LGHVGKINEAWLLHFGVFFTLNMQEVLQMSVFYTLLQHVNINCSAHKFKVSRFHFSSPKFRPRLWVPSSVLCNRHWHSLGWG